MVIWLTFPHQLITWFMNDPLLKFLISRTTSFDVEHQIIEGGDPPTNTVIAGSEGGDFDIEFIQPQGTTKRPFDIPSLVDLSTTTPIPSPLLQESFTNVPNTNQG